MFAIKVVDVIKSFKVYYDKGQSLKEKLLFRNRNTYEKRMVLDGVSLEIERGEAVGLIGTNGCGKSTLLKLMTKIIYPDSGKIEISGKVSSLIELGAGFHPDMTGRENIYTNASIFGLNKKEIDSRINKIIEFSELGAYIDNPVRTYSSGMYMRLAFSVAINVDAEVLLIDEILAVGDANFQAKCFNNLRELKSKGVTIVIVTHDMGTVERFCTKAVWLRDGNIVRQGTPIKVVDAYLSHMNQLQFESLEKKANIENEKSEKNETSDIINYNAEHFGLKYIEIKKAHLLNAYGKETVVLKGGDAFSIKIDYVRHKEDIQVMFGIGISTIEGINIFSTNTQLDSYDCNTMGKMGTITFNAEKLELLSGKYILQVAVCDIDGTPMDFYRRYCIFDIINSSRAIGITDISHQWNLFA